MRNGRRRTRERVRQQPPSQAGAASQPAAAAKLPRARKQQPAAHQHSILSHPRTTSLTLSLSLSLSPHTGIFDDKWPLVSLFYLRGKDNIGEAVLSAVLRQSELESRLRFAVTWNRSDLLEDELSAIPTWLDNRSGILREVLQYALELERPEMVRFIIISLTTSLLAPTSLGAPALTSHLPPLSLTCR